MATWRRDFHRHPELGFDEHRTSARVADLLESFGLEVHRGVGRTGVVGVLQRGNAPRSIGLRADMDALPIQETTGLDHQST
ncbi:MAG: amidohydrolase, partial [Pseudomonadota bacterium]